jgi:hypothetical protein
MRAGDELGGVTDDQAVPLRPAAREKGYLVNVEDKRGRAARWRRGSPLPDDVVILPLALEGVKPHPEPASHTPAEAAPQVSDGVNDRCEGVNQPRGGESPGDADLCTECGEPLDRALIDAGYTDHGETP